MKNDKERGLFRPAEMYTAINGEKRYRKVLKSDRMWFYPPECPGHVGSRPSNPDVFFRNRLFFWRPVGVWKYSLRCPRDNCPAKGKDFFYTEVDTIPDVDRFVMATPGTACCVKSYLVGHATN